MYTGNLCSQRYVIMITLSFVQQWLLAYLVHSIPGMRQSWSGNAVIIWRFCNDFCNITYQQYYDISSHYKPHIDHNTKNFFIHREILPRCHAEITSLESTDKMLTWMIFYSCVCVCQSSVCGLQNTPAYAMEIVMETLTWIRIVTWLNLLYYPGNQIQI